jgi:UDP:flavonoid glycosyltransferase YjiC (YdhE family)
LKTKKLLRHFSRLLDQQDHRRREERAALESLLEQLREKREKLQAELEEEEDPASAAKLNRKLALVAAQIQKGERILGEGQT